MAEKSILIGVMGVTGAGKSSLIKTITKKRSIMIGHTLQSGEQPSSISHVLQLVTVCKETTTTEAHEFAHRGLRYTLVDCPGFNDTNRPDSEVLKDIVGWFSKRYGEGTLLSGIIYLHPINNPRVQGSSVTQFRVFKALCGEDFYGNVVIGTTFWSRVNPDEGRQRQEELFGDGGFFGDMRKLGARTARISESRTDCIRLVEQFAAYKRAGMKVQREMAKGSSFDATGAAKILANYHLPKGYRRVVYRVGQTYRAWKHRRQMERLGRESKKRIEKEQAENAAKLLREVELHEQHVLETQAKREKRTKELNNEHQRARADQDERQRTVDRRREALREEGREKGECSQRGEKEKRVELAIQRADLEFEQRLMQHGEAIRNYDVAHFEWKKRRHDALETYQKSLTKKGWTWESSGFVCSHHLSFRTPLVACYISWS